MAKKSEAQIKFSADTADLRSGLSDVNKSMTLLTNELKLNATQLKGNAGDVDLLSTRQNLLQQKLEESRSKVSLTEQAMQKAKDTLGENSTEYNKLANEVLRAKNQEAAIKNELDDVNKKLDKQEETVDDVGKSMENSSGSALTFGEAIKANVIGGAILGGFSALKDKIVDVVGSLKDAALNAGTFADDLITTSNQTGISTQNLQELDYAMRFIDVDMNTLTGAMARNIKQMGAGNDTYKQLGVSVKDSNGHLKDSQTVFYEVIDALGKVSNETERDALAMDIFGKSAQDLNPLILAGGEQLKAYCKEAEDLGLVLDDETVASLGALDDAMQTNDATMDTFKNKIGAALAPALQELAENASEFIQEADFTAVSEKAEALAEGMVDAVGTVGESIEKASDWCEQHETALQLVAVGVGTVAVAVGAYSAAEGLKNIAVKTGIAAEGQATVAMGLHATATTISTAATTAFGAAVSFLTSPITLVVAAIGLLTAAGVLLYKNWDTVKEKAGALKDGVVGKLSGLSKGGIEKFNALKKSGSDVIDGVKDKFESGINKIKGFFNFQFKWPHLSLPHFGISPAGWKAGDLLKGTIPKLSIKWYADGAVFTKPTVINTPYGVKGFGEAGEEAALPITTLRSYMRDVLDDWSAGNVMGFEVDYDRLGNSVAKAMTKVDQSLVLNKREFGRVVREVI